MSFLSPLFLLGALTAAIPIVLHFLHRQPEPRVRFAAVRLLRHAPVEHTRRRRLREWLLLALRVGALVLLAFAFARPFFASASAARGGHVTVIALDTSMSMSAPGRFARARQLANDALAKAGVGDLVGVVTFADTARDAVAPTTDHALAKSAVDAAQPGFGGTHYRAALSAAARMIDAAGGTSATILVVTDLQASGWDSGDRAAIPERARVELADAAGGASANLAVTAIRADHGGVVATVRNLSPAARDAIVRLAVDGRAAGSASVSLGPSSTAEVQLPAASGDTAAVSVDDVDGIQGDNTRFIVLNSASRPAVLIVTANGDPGREAFYLQQALSPLGGSASYVVSGMAAAKVGVWDARRDRSSVVLLASTRGLDARGRETLTSFLHGGGGMFVAAGADVDGDVVSELVDGAAVVTSGSRAAAPRTFAPVDYRHPVFEAFGAQAAALGLVEFRETASMSQKQCVTIAKFSTGEPALEDCAVGAGRALLFASDLDNRGNDFPLHPSFVPFVQEAVRYLGSGREESSDVLVSEVPSGVPAVPGIATIAATATSPARRVAVNVDPAESSAERLSPAEFQSAVTTLRAEGQPELRLEASQQESREHVWQYAMFAAMVLLAAESLVSTRAA